jgi:hypothetical protein
MADTNMCHLVDNVSLVFNSTCYNLTKNDTAVVGSQSFCSRLQVSEAPSSSPAAATLPPSAGVRRSSASVLLQWFSFLIQVVGFRLLMKQCLQPLSTASHLNFFNLCCVNSLSTLIEREIQIGNELAL